MGLDDLVKIGMRIRVERQKRDLKQKDLAEKLGIPVTTLSGYENGHREPPQEIITAVLKLFDMNIYDLILDEQDRVLNSLIFKIDRLGRGYSITGDPSEGYVWIHTPKGTFEPTFEQLEELEKESSNYLIYLIERMIEDSPDSFYKKPD